MGHDDVIDLTSTDGTPQLDWVQRDSDVLIACKVSPARGRL